MAAEKEFLTKGFAAARTTAIAEAAGVTHAMLHYYFRTKDKLFHRVIDDKLSALARTFSIKIEEATSLHDSVRQAVESHFDFVRANPLLPRFMVCEVFSNDALIDVLSKKLSRFASAAITILQSKIDQAVASGECRSMDALTLILDIVSLNVFPILALPMIRGVRNLPQGDEVERFLDQRKEENIKIILRRLY